MNLSTKDLKEKYINISHPHPLLIIESSASDIGYGGVLKQAYNNHIHIVKYHLGIWFDAQINHSTIKKEVLSIIFSIMIRY